MIINLISGALSGFISTIPMTAVMGIGQRLLPDEDQYPLPPRHITMKVTQQLGIQSKLSESDRELLTLISHFGYGAAMGAVYGVLTNCKKANATNGALFGLGVWTVSYLGWLPAVGLFKSATREPADRNTVMITAHLAWGAVLGKLMDSYSEPND